MPKDAKLLEPDIRTKTVVDKEAAKIAKQKDKNILNKDLPTKTLSICTYKIQFVSGESAQAFKDFV